VEENGKPLSGKAAKEEEKKYQAAVAERRRMNAELKNTLFHREFRFGIGYGEWPDLFVATSGGDEIVDGHEVIKLILNSPIRRPPRLRRTKGRAPYCNTNLD
jgi:hypothetical protein